MVRRCLKECPRDLRPAIHRGHGERVFALKMMEECALGHSSLRAELVDRGRRIAFLADEHERCFQELLASPRPGALQLTLFSHRGNIPTSRYNVNRPPKDDLRQTQVFGKRTLREP